jgi:LEA14-like dessication related protein
VKARKISWFLALFCILSGLVVSKSLQDDIKISLKGTRIKDFSMAGLSYVFYLNIANSSSSSYYLSGYDYRFLVNQKEYFRLQRSLDKRIEIEPRKSKLLSFPIKITFDHLFRLVEGIEGEGNLEGKWTGTMSFSDAKKDRGRLLFDFSGEFPVIKELEFKFFSLQVEDLTIGGADTRFEASLVNPNIFDVLIEKISYKFYLRDNLISEKTVSGGKTIVSRGEQSYSFPMLINFFEVGKEVYTMLQMTSSLCRFTGEIEVRTKWGRVKIPFDQTGRVSIARTS